MRAPVLSLLTLSLGFLVLAGWAVLGWVHKQASLPSCEMTYNYNGYVPQASHMLPNNTGYALYLYREGAVHYGPKGPPNVPVLFIPGNAGRHMQGRSLASESGRQWQRAAAETAAMALSQSKHGVVNLDWYTVDTREHLSAFHGDVLEAQTEYVLYCLRYLQDSYGLRGNAQTGIIVVGHSMGGVVARAAAARAALDPDLGPGLVSLLLTLASPHQRPPLPSHPSLHRFFSRLARLPVPAIPLVSLAGGYNDTEVAQALTSLQGVARPGLSLHTSLESVPGVWASAHHNCIVWCNQLTVQLSSMLLGLAKELKEAAATDAAVDEAQGPSGSAGQGEDAGEAAATVTAAKGVGGRQGSARRGDVLGRRNKLVMRHVRKALLGSSLHSQLQLHTSTTTTAASAAASGATDGASRPSGSSSGPSAGGSSDGVGLADVLARAAGQQCKGANLAWYMQYVTPRTVSRPLLQLRQTNIKDGLGKTGRLYHWPLNTSSLDDQPRGTSPSSTKQLARSWSLLVSSSKPCSGFRVWLLRGGGAYEDGLGRDVDVTAMAVRLPPLHAAARQRVRVWSEHEVVMKGKDYQAAASWVLRLTPEMLQGAEGIIVWLGEVSIRKAFHLSAQLSSSGSSDGGLPAATAQLLQVVPAPQAGPQQQALVSQLHLQAPPLPLRALLPWRGLALRVVLQASPQPKHKPDQEQGSGEQKAKRRTPASPRKCLAPVLVTPESGGQAERITANLTTFNLATCGSIGGSSSSNSSSATAGCAVVSGTGASSAAAEMCTVALLLDPGCSYKLQLVPDLASPLTEMLLQRLHLLWGLAQAVLLLAACYAPAALGALTREANPSAKQGQEQEGGVRGSSKPVSSQFSALCACIVHGLAACTVVLLVLQLPALATGFAQQGQAGGSWRAAGGTANLKIVSTFYQNLRAVLGEDATARLLAAWGAADQWLAIPMDQLAALTVVAPLALWAVSGEWISMSCGVLASLLVAAAAYAAPLLHAPVAAQPAASVLQADELLVLLPFIAFLLLTLHGVLALLSRLLHGLWSLLTYPLSWLRPRKVIAAPKQPHAGSGAGAGASSAGEGTSSAGDAASGASGGAASNSQETGDGSKVAGGGSQTDGSQVAGSGSQTGAGSSHSAGEGSARESARGVSSKSGRTTRLRWLVPLLTAALTLNEQLVATGCLLLLLVAAHQPQPASGPGMALASVQARLWLLLFTVGTAVSLPSLLAWAQLLRDATPSIGPSDLGPLRGLVATHQLFSVVPVGDTTVAAVDALRPLLVAAACLAVRQRLGSVVTGRASGSGHAGRRVLAQALALAGLACTAMGLDWVPGLLHPAAAMVAWWA